MNIHNSIIFADQTSPSSYDSGVYGGGSYSVGQSATTGPSSSRSLSPSTTATGATGGGSEQQTTVQLVPQTAPMTPQHASSLLWAWLLMFVATAALMLFTWRLIASRRRQRNNRSVPPAVQPNPPAAQADSYSSPRDPDFLF